MIVKNKAPTDNPRARGPVDRIVGSNIRMHRLNKGVSQSDLGKAVGVTFQQVQKYENGANRLGTARLHKVAETLGVSVADLYIGVETNGADSGADNPVLLLSEKHALDLLRVFVRIKNHETRRMVVTIADMMGVAETALEALKSPKAAKRA